MLGCGFLDCVGLKGVRYKTNLSSMSVIRIIRHADQRRLKNTDRYRAKRKSTYFSLKPADRDIVGVHKRTVTSVNVAHDTPYNERKRKRFIIRYVRL